jgi:uncharacterized phage-associated protein
MVALENHISKNSGHCMKNNSYETIADFFIGFANETGSLITNLKLQKLVYYAQAWSLGLNNKELFPEEFEAWVHGPVLRDLYNKYKENKWGPINKNVKLDDVKKKLGASDLKLLQEVADIYFELDAYKLEKLTHLEEPWIEARGNLAENEPCANKISKATMRRYYHSIATA